MCSCLQTATEKALERVRLRLGIDKKTPLDVRLMGVLLDAVVFTFWYSHSSYAMTSSSTLWLFLGAMTVLYLKP
jgi:hypothetical protein